MPALVLPQRSGPKDPARTTDLTTLFNLAAAGTGTAGCRRAWIPGFGLFQALLFRWDHENQASGIKTKPDKPGIAGLTGVPRTIK